MHGRITGEDKRLGTIDLLYEFESEDREPIFDDLLSV
jgi:hypothetical protein